MRPTRHMNRCTLLVLVALTTLAAPVVRAQPGPVPRYPLGADAPPGPTVAPPVATAQNEIPPPRPPSRYPLYEGQTEELSPVWPQGPAIPPEPPPPLKSGLEALQASAAPHGQDPHVDTGCGVFRVPYFPEDFADEGLCYELPYDPHGELGAYEGKKWIPTQRPWIEWGRPFYDWGQFPPGSTIFGEANLAASQFLLYGDFRTAIASNNDGNNSTNVMAARLNLELDWKVTSTERFHTSFQPMNKGQNFTRLDFDSDDLDFQEEFNLDPFTGFFEGDLGAIWGGMTGQVLPFDLPVAVGFMPLVFQNGIWLEDNVIGAAVTLPARNSPLLDISNYDITFFTLFDNVDSPAFQGDNNAAMAYGVAGFFEMLEGYIELDYAYLDDQTGSDRSYHNLGIGYTRRYFSFLSNSVRLISNLGQDPNGIAPTADGTLLLFENSLITKNPYLFVPYCNAFVGFRRVQSVARNGAAGGILRNTGILFETDNLTGYPTLDPTGNDTYGAAIGVNLIPATIDRQLVLEYAFVGVMDRTLANTLGNQHGMGLRFQKNLTNAWLFRADGMYGFREDDDDLSGARMELRYKF